MKGRICLTRIDVTTRNGKIYKKSKVHHKLIDQRFIVCEHDFKYEEKQANLLAKGVCEAYNMFISNYPSSQITILIKMSYFSKNYQNQNGVITNASYVQLDIQYIQYGFCLVENCYIDINQNFKIYIFNTLCNMNSYCQKERYPLKSQHIYEKIIFRDKAAAILTHEFSHLFEADIYLYSRKFINEINKCVKLNDIYYHHSLPPICLDIDDEFSLNQDLTIVERGVIKNILVDKKWSQIYHTDLYGNGRRTFQENAPILPRIRISQMQYSSELIIDEFLSELKDYIVIDNIKSGKLMSKEGTVIFNIEDAQYHHCGEVIYLKPFSIQCSIMEIINNIMCASKEDYYSVYPCGKNGYQLPCGIITPSKILTKGENIYVL